MKILQVVPSYYPATIYGGPIFSVHLASQALADVGVQVDVATTNANGCGKLDTPTDTPVQLSENYKVRYYDDTIINRFSWAFTKGLPSNIRHAEVVHLQDVFSAHAAWTFILCWWQKKPLVISVRGVFTPWGLNGKRSWLKRLWLKFLVAPFVRNSNRVLWHATAESEKKETIDVFENANVTVIPNGINLAEYDAAKPLTREEVLAKYLPKYYVGKKKTTVLLGLGRLHAKKSFDVAIDAMPLLVEASPNIILLIAGADDGEKQKLERQIDRLGMQNNIFLLGEIIGDSKVDLLRCADLFVFPSHNENFGMVALEALACGTPVVASKNTPWQDLQTFQSGRWVENNADDFRRAISDLILQNSDGMSERARAHAEQFDLSKIAHSFKDSYFNLLTQQRLERDDRSD